MPTVLLVDGDDGYARGAAFKLRAAVADLTVVTANSRAEAVHAAKLRRPEVVILNMSLPDGDGLALQAEIKSELPAAQIIVTSTDWSPADRRRAEASSAFKVFDRNADAALLVRAIKEALAVYAALSSRSTPPRSPTAKPDAPAPPKASIPSEGDPAKILQSLRKVLVVDDSNLHANMCAMVFAPYDSCRVEFARNGLEAFDKLEKNEDVDLIILDINMPKMDGISFLREMKQRHLAHVPVIVVSTEDKEMDIKTALQAGARGYATKPWKASRFRDLIARVVSANARVTEEDQCERSTTAPVATFDKVEEKIFDNEKH